MVGEVPHAANGAGVDLAWQAVLQLVGGQCSRISTGDTAADVGRDDVVAETILHVADQLGRRWNKKKKDRSKTNLANRRKTTSDCKQQWGETSA